MWTCAVLSNVVHCTSASCVANWWYREEPSKTIVKKSFKRSLTSLLGSICLGSLLLALIRKTRLLLEFLIRRIEVAEGLVPSAAVSALQRYVLNCLRLVLGGMDWLLEYFNKYAFCYGE